MIEPHYCSLCECICVACAQLEDGCESCELLHPELLDENENEKDYMCVDCANFQKCLEEYNMEYEELHECSICGNFEVHPLLMERFVNGLVKPGSQSSVSADDK